jgi:hypothetical protein
VAEKVVLKEEDVTAPDAVTIENVAIDIDACLHCKYPTSKSYSVLIGISPEEINEWASSYQEDAHFGKVITG